MQRRIVSRHLDRENHLYGNIVKWKTFSGKNSVPFIITLYRVNKDNLNLVHVMSLQRTRFRTRNKHVTYLVWLSINISKYINNYSIK